jgi:hypothetical protein
MDSTSMQDDVALCRSATRTLRVLRTPAAPATALFTVSLLRQVDELRAGASVTSSKADELLNDVQQLHLRCTFAASGQ